jgi:hypothetical protein
MRIKSSPILKIFRKKNMRIKSTLVSAIALVLAIVGFASAGYSQAKRPSSSIPRIEVQNYKIEATLTPDAHELKAAASITFKPLQPTDLVVLSAATIARPHAAVSAF